MNIPAGIAAGQTWLSNHRNLMAVAVADGRLAAVEMAEHIPLELIDPSPINRTNFSAEKAREMEDSLREHGQTTPAIVRPTENGRYELVAGERRFRGCKAVGMTHLLAMVRVYSETEAAEILLIENLKREDLGPIEEARIYQRLLDLKDAEGVKVYTLQRIAERVHDDIKKVTRISRMLVLLDLPLNVKEALENDVIPMRVAVLIGRIADENDRFKAGGEVLNSPMYGRPMTVREAQEWINQKYQINLNRAPLDRFATELLTTAQKQELGMTGKPGEQGDGSCERCPWLAKNHPVFQNELASGAQNKAGEQGVHPLTCTRASCYQLKVGNQWAYDAEVFSMKHKATRVVGLHEKVDVVLLDEKPSVQHLGVDLAVDVTWRKLLKVANVPVVVVPVNAAGEKGAVKPMLAVERALAITAVKQHHAELFEAVPEPGTKGLQGMEPSPQEKAAAEEEQRQRQAKQKLDTAVKVATREACLREMMARICERGMDVEALRGLFDAVSRTVDNMTLYVKFLTGQACDEAQLETRLAEVLPVMTPNALLGAITVLAVWDDVIFSGLHHAADFGALRKALGIDCHAIEKAERARLESATAESKKDSKLQSRKGEADPHTERVNEQVAVQGILDAGDAQRVEAPSRAMELPKLETEDTREDLISEETGVSKELLKICSEWREKHSNATVSEMATGLKISYLGAKLVWRVMEGEFFPEEELKLPDELLQRCWEWLEMEHDKPSALVMALELDITLKEAEMALKVFAENCEADEDEDDGSPLEWSWEEKVAAYAAGTHDIPALIGVKPNRKDVEPLKAWDAERGRLKRAAAKLNNEVPDVGEERTLL